MDIGPNIYPLIVHALHPKVRELLDMLDQSGQVDRDETNTPHILSVEIPSSSVHRCIFVRNGKPENFIIHTRRRAEPIKSWADGDGYIRKEISVSNEPISRKERDRRSNPFESIMEQILPKRT